VASGGLVETEEASNKSIQPLLLAAFFTPTSAAFFGRSRTLQQSQHLLEGIRSRYLDPPPSDRIAYPAIEIIALQAALSQWQRKISDRQNIPAQPVVSEQDSENVMGARLCRYSF
jgi:hypothetical protein